MSLIGERKRLVDLADETAASPSEKEVLEATAKCRLRQSCYPEVRGVACDSHEGVLTLRGRVSSYYMKQVVQTVVFGMDGVGVVNNRVEVTPPPHSR